MNLDSCRRLELNGGRVSGRQSLRFELPPVETGYADAQIDDYGLVEGSPLSRRRLYPWRPGAGLRLRARFSHDCQQLQGTAGFGFWNAPFGDPTVRLPALPQAAWFFFASPPGDLPLAADGPGQGWFAAALDAGAPRALLTAPLAPAVLLLNQFSRVRRRLWPWVRRRLSISHAYLELDMRQWHEYRLDWLPEGCRFSVDGIEVLHTSHSPRGPLGFVCWLDNQYLQLTNRGRFSWGTLAAAETQWMEVADLEIGAI